MKATLQVGAAVLASFAIGALTATLLHAQAKPPAYVVAEIDVNDEDGYSKEFLPKARANIKSSGGKYLAGAFNNAVSFSGAPPPNRLVLLQFPDMETAKSFGVKENQIESELNGKYAKFRAFAIEGVEPK